MIDKCHYKAVRSAGRALGRSGYRIVYLFHDPVFDLEAASDVEIRKVSIVIGKPSKDDRARVDSVRFPPTTKKEIWWRERGKTEFTRIPPNGL